MIMVSVGDGTGRMLAVDLVLYISEITQPTKECIKNNAKQNKMITKSNNMNNLLDSTRQIMVNYTDLNIKIIQK